MRPPTLTALAVLAALAALAALAPFAAAGDPKAPGDVSWWTQVGDGKGGFSGALGSGEWFGRAVAAIGDVDGDGVTDVAVGANLSDDGGDRRGSVWIVFLNADGTAKGQQEISDTEGGFTGTLDNIDWFGTSVAGLGDLDEDGVPDLAVGAALDDDGSSNRGAVWILYLNADGTVKTWRKISSTSGGFFGPLSTNAWFGCSLANLGDLDDDGNPELAVGAYRDLNTGSVWVLFLNADETVKSYVRIAGNQGGFVGSLGNLGEFGYSVANLGDVDGDGVTDLAVGARRGCDGGGPPCNLGRAYVLRLNSNGTVKGQQLIADGTGGFGQELQSYAFFGSGVAGLGDLDGDGVVDLAVGCEQDDDGGPAFDENANLGAVYLFFLDVDGSARTYRKISRTQGNFGGKLKPSDRFGQSLANLGDLDGDGVVDLAVGSEDEGQSANVGSFWVLGLADPMGFGTGFPDVSEVGVPIDAALDPLGGTPPYVVDLKKGALPPGVTVLVDGTIQGAPTKKGKYTFELRLIDDEGAITTQKVVHKVAAPVKLVGADLDAAKHGKGYQYRFKSKGGVAPFLFTEVTETIPAGLYLDPQAGTLEGEPEEVGAFEFTVRVTDALGATATADYVLPVKPTLKITTKDLGNGKVGKPYDELLKAKGGFKGKGYAFEIAKGSLPDGLSLGSDGAITGTPTAKGKSTFIARVVDDVGETAEKTFTVKVK